MCCYVYQHARKYRICHVHCTWNDENRNRERKRERQERLNRENEQKEKKRKKCDETDKM